MGSIGGPDGVTKAISYCCCCDATVVARDRDLHQRTMATMRTVPKRPKEIHIRIDTTLGVDRCSTYMSALPGGDEMMLHSVHVVIIRRMAISDTPVSIC